MYNVISANRSKNRAAKNWRVFEREMLEKHFGPALDVDGEDGISVLEAARKYNPQYIRWYPDPELLTKTEYDGILNQDKHINLPYITSSAKGFLAVQNKEEAFNIWRAADINCPRHFEYSDRYNFYSKLEGAEFSYPFLLRLNNDVGGQNTYCIREEKDLYDSLIQLDLCYEKYVGQNPRINTKKICVQLINTVNNDVNLSFRIHVAGNKVISGYARVVDKNEWCAITAGKFNIKNIDNWVKYNILCQEIMEKHNDEICRAIHILKLNHQGVDVVIDQDTGRLCFLEVQPTYAAGYPQTGYCGYFPPYYNPSDSALVNFLQQNKLELEQKLPYYYNNWLDKKNHFDLVFKNLREYIN